MDNVVQNIRLEDIIPSSFQNNDHKIIEDLVDSIKNYGILEPLIIRPKNGKYEIILGNKRYEAAKILGLEIVPALIKNVDDEVFNQYLMINKNNTTSNSTNKFINLVSISPKEQQKQKKEETVSIQKKSPSEINSKQSQNIFENNNFKIDYNRKQISDIVNLSELSKEEYERNDLKMNNEQLNNNVMNNNFGAPQSTPSVQEPTFGGRFFPSLEDEPTNMNMGGMTSNPMNQIQQPTSNLIDLTDIGMEREPQISASQNLTTLDPIQPQVNYTQNLPEMNSQPMINNQVEIPQSNELSNPIPDSTSNIINIENIQNDNPPIQPESIGIENQFIGNMTNSTPMMEPISNIPQFDMSQNIAPAEFIQNQDITPNSNMIENDFNMNQSNNFAINQPEPTPYVEPLMNQPMQDFGMTTYNQGIEPQVTPMPLNEPVMSITSQDITPVMNTLKSLATNLEAFGYKINISEEELPTSIKLTIEVEK